MINFKEIRGLLLAALEREGFGERREKSCRAYRVFSDGGTTLLVQPNDSGEYDYYTNPDDARDFGDVTHFILSRKLGISTHGELNLDRGEFLLLQRELERLGAYASTLSTPPHRSRRPAGEQPLFRLSAHPLADPSKDPAAAEAIGKFLQRRGITASPDDPDIAGLVTALKTDKGYLNPLFLWRDIESRVKGAQYKYMASDRETGKGKCVKRFLPHSDRQRSLWWTPLEGRSGLFVCEDPLDALAHRQLHPGKNYAYAATGGTVTPGQVEMIYRLREQSCAVNSPTPSGNRHGAARFPLILGNDNDTAGQLAALRILLPGSRVSYDKAAEVVRITSPTDGGAPAETINIPLTGLPRYIDETAASKDIPVAIESPTPPAKDWNEMLVQKQP